MITGFVRGQSLKVTTPTVVGDTIDYITAQFTFLTAEWEGAYIYSHWTKDDVTYSVPLTDGRIGESEHLNLSAGKWSVYLHGEKYDGLELVQRITTESAVIIVGKSGMLLTPFPDVPASEAERVHAAAVEAEKKAAEAAASANEAERYADLAEQVAVENGFVIFDLDYKTGEVFLTRTDNICDELDFTINNQTGELEAIIS